MSAIDGTESAWWRRVAMGTAAKRGPKRSSEAESERDLARRGRSFISGDKEKETTRPARAINSLPDTHARTHAHRCTHTHSLGFMCWQIKVQSGTGLDQYTYSQENTHPHNLSVCVSWPGFNSSLNVTRLSLGQLFDVTRTKTPMKRWSCWSQLNLMSAWMVTAGDGPRVSYHASTWTGRQIHCVRVEWGTQWMVCTQYGSLYECTVGLNGWGQTC